MSSRRRERRPEGQAGPAAPARVPPPASLDRRLAITCVVLTTLAATLMRVWFPVVWHEAGTPASAFYQGDTRAFLAYAADLVAGRPFDNGIPFHPPGWPFVLALFYRVMGFSPLAGRPIDPDAIKVFVAAISGLAVGLSTLLAGELAGTGAMLAVALLGTFHFGHIVEGTTPNSEALYGLLLVVALLLAWSWLRHTGDRAPGRGRRWIRPLLLGAVCGFATLVRAEFELCAALLLAARWLPTLPRRGRVSESAAFVVGLVLLLAPSTVAHWRSLSAFNAAHTSDFPGPLPTFAPVTSYGAFNFAMGNHENADGEPNSDHPLLATCTPEESKLLAEGQLDLSCPAVYDLFVHGYGIGASWLVTHPARALWLIGRRASMTSGVFALGYFAGDLPAGVDGVRRRADLLDPADRILWPVHLALIIAGALLLWRRRQVQALVLLALPLITLAASALLFYGYVRLGVAYLPVFWVLEGTALAALAGRVVAAPRIRRQAPAVVLAIGLAALALQAVAGSSPRPLILTGPRQPDGRLIQDETIRIRQAP
ncbi:MAG TPA: hypothetical protein VNE16_03970 [Vicinamibacterales bacterium]|nr:hypothetical protein [Vicinamibacterales bacterium]